MAADSSIESLRSERDQVAERLYQTSRAKEPGRHRHWEQRWNDLNRQILGREGDQQSSLPYQYRRDVRDNFTFATRTGVDSHGRSIQTVHVEGRIEDPDTVINWRNTSIGRRQDAVARRAVSGGTGDDAGHLVALEFGADPAQRLNLARQNPTQNQAGGTWRHLETRIGDYCRSEPGRVAQFRCDERYLPDQRGLDRPVGRQVDVTYGKAGPHGSLEPAGRRQEHLAFMNSIDHEVRTERTCLSAPEAVRKQSSARPAEPGGAASPQRQAEKRAQYKAQIQAEADRPEQHRAVGPRKPGARG